jgi:hypothetical protein
MNRFSIAVFVSLTLLFLSEGVAQTPNARPEEQLLALAREVQTQQAQIVDNQAKIDSKLAEIAEAIRQARIYSKREK